MALTKGDSGGIGEDVDDAGDRAMSAVDELKDVCLRDAVEFGCSGVMDIVCTFWLICIGCTNRLVSFTTDVFG